MKKNSWIPLIVALAFAFSRGIKEGMVMVLSNDSMWVGPRQYLKGHAWFEWYHAISLLPFLLFGLSVYLLLKYRPGILYILGLSILIWQFTEMGENFARNMKVVAPYERIVIIDLINFTIKGWKMYMLHTVRILLGITLIHIWR